MMLGKGEKPRRGTDVVLIFVRGWELVRERNERNKRRRIGMEDFAIADMTRLKEWAVENSKLGRRTEN
jgi:hypothetical protein